MFYCRVPSPKHLWRKMLDEAIAQWQSQDEGPSLDDVLGTWAESHGGSHQRLRAAGIVGRAPPSQPKRPDSSLAARLVELNSWGLMSASEVQDLAMSAQQDGCDHPEVLALARIGASGDHPQNCSRDLAALYKLDQLHIPEPYVMKLPLYDPKGNPPSVVLGIETHVCSLKLGSPQPCVCSVEGTGLDGVSPVCHKCLASVTQVWIDHPIMLAHELLGSLHDHFPVEFLPSVTTDQHMW